MRPTLSKVAELWESTQVELHGRYSAGRVLELATYARETSWIRVIAVLLITPLPCLVVTVVADIFPLADPSEGINANFMFIIREYYSYLVMNFLSIQQFRTSVPALSYPLKRVLGNTIAIAMLCVGVFYCFALTIGFPLPFSIVTVMPVWIIAVTISMGIEWTQQVRETPGAGTMILNVVKVWMCEVLLVVIYPPYFFVFTILSYKTQMGFALLLPVIKILMRNIFVRTVVHLRDDLPEVVVFNVEVFNALFVSYCMQNSPSIWTTLELMAADIVLLGLSLRDMEVARRGLEELENRIERDTNWVSDHMYSIKEGNASALEQVSKLLRDEMAPQTALIAPFARLPQELPHHTTPLARPRPQKNDMAKNSLVVIAKDACSTFALAPHPLRAAKQLFGKGSIHPMVEDVLTPGNSARKVPIRLRYTRKVRRLLYMAEFLLLLNYVEVVIPLVFSIYLCAMYHLPNREYYTQLAGMNRDELLMTLKNVLFYCSLQLLSLLVLACALQRKLGLSPIRQLAFVLEKQFAGVQTKLVFWVFYNVQASLKHFGYDYTFAFRWLHHQSNEISRDRQHHAG